MPGPVFGGPFHLSGAGSPSGYGRYANPTWVAWEAALADLEGGPALGFASGMAACSAILLSLLGSGDVLVASSDIYGVVPKVVREDVERLGVDVRWVASDLDALRGALDGATLVWVESPSNPELKVLDIPALAVAVREAGAKLVVDETVATPLIMPALDLGADVVVVSDSKAMTGHSDLILGHMASRDEAVINAVRGWRDRTGAVPGPFEAWLAHRSLVTLDVRLERSCANALALARALDGDSRVGRVLYPGLESHPGHEIAVRAMGERFGPVLSFDLGSEEAAERFLSTAELVTDATSFGGAHTTAERRGRWGMDEIGPGFIRLSAGLEDAGDLVADVRRAVDAALA